MATTKRKFNVSYGNALEYSKDMRNLFLDDSDDFVAFDADFDEDFTDEWLAEMQAAERPVEFYTYKDDNHNLAGYFTLAMNRTIAFFDTYLKP